MEDILLDLAVFIPKMLLAIIPIWTIPELLGVC